MPLSLYAYQWNWSSAVTDPAFGEVTSNTGINTTLSVLKFSDVAVTEDAVTVDELMAALEIGTLIRMKATASSTVRDWNTTNLPTKSGTVWSVPVAPPGSGSGGLGTSGLFDIGFLLDDEIDGTPPDPPDEIPPGSTVQDSVDEIRSMLQGTFADEVSLLEDAYLVDDGTITLKYPKRSVIAGALLTVGLNTFYVLAITPDGTNITVLPKYDGGPDLDMPAGSIVRIKPQFTNWAIFREFCTDIQAMSSPFSALWSPRMFTASVNQFSGMYQVPPEIKGIQKIVRVRVRRYGTGEWAVVTGGEYIPELHAIRLYGFPDGSTLEFTMAAKYTVPTNLTNDLEAFCGIPPTAQDIPTYGAAAALALANEGRRQQPFSQGDPRKAQEISPGANIGVSRAFGKVREDRVRDEQSRLIQMYGYQRHITTQTADGSPFTRAGGRW